MIRNAQNAVRRFLPSGGAGSGKLIALAAVVLVGIWGASGFYRVQPDELGVVMRFGAFDRTAPPGLNYRIPWPVETVTTPRVTRINRVDVGFRGAPDTAPGRDCRRRAGPKAVHPRVRRHFPRHREDADCPRGSVHHCSKTSLPDTPLWPPGSPPHGHF
jgi:hypothetical protein